MKKWWHPGKTPNQKPKPNQKTQPPNPTPKHPSKNCLKNQTNKQTKCFPDGHSIWNEGSPLDAPWTENTFISTNTRICFLLWYLPSCCFFVFVVFVFFVVCGFLFWNTVLSFGRMSLLQYFIFELRWFIIYYLFVARFYKRAFLSGRRAKLVIRYGKHSYMIVKLIYNFLV